MPNEIELLEGEYNKDNKPDEIDSLWFKVIGCITLIITVFIIF